jgi:hypothetical protein
MIYEYKKFRAETGRKSARVLLPDDDAGNGIIILSAVD